MEAKIETEPGTPKTVDKYKILHIQPIGRGFRAQVEYENKSKKWISGRETDKERVKQFKELKEIQRNSIQQNTNSREKKNKPAKNLLTTILIIMSILPSLIGAQKIQGNFTFCQTQGIGRIINPSIDCRHPHKENEQNTTTIIDPQIQFPTQVFVLSKNRYYADETGY